jgi:hypothetical protein
MPAVLLFAIDVAAAGVDITGVGVICSGVASAAADAPQSAQHAHSTCSEVCDVSDHPNGVRMIHLPGQLGFIQPGSLRDKTDRQVLPNSVRSEIRDGVFAT